MIEIDIFSFCWYFFPFPDILQQHNDRKYGEKDDVIKVGI